MVRVREWTLGAVGFRPMALFGPSVPDMARANAIVVCLPWACCFCHCLDLVCLYGQFNSFWERSICCRKKRELARSNTRRKYLDRHVKHLVNLSDSPDIKEDLHHAKV